MIIVEHVNLLFQVVVLKRVFDPCVSIENSYVGGRPAVLWLVEFVRIIAESRKREGNEIELSFQVMMRSIDCRRTC